MYDWLKYAEIRKESSRKFAISFRFTDEDEEFSGCRCSGDHVLDVFVGYTKSRKEAEEQARGILEKYERKE